MKIGINLFSLHKIIDTGDKLHYAVSKLKEIGYDYIQYSGAPFEAEKVKKLIDSTSMPVLLTHVPMDRIVDQTEKLIEEHLYIGCKNIGLGKINGDITNEKEIKANIEKLERAAQIIEANGCHFFYHHHHFEFYKLSDGKTLLEYMIENAPHINFTIDTYWLQYGGADIYDYLEKLNGRMGCVHLKDYKIFSRDGKLSPGYAPVGDGTMNFAKLIPEMKKRGAQLFIVEQDDASSYDDPFEQLRRSYDYIKKIMG